MSSCDLQREMNFGTRQNRFRDDVRQGVFTLLIESGIPQAQISPQTTLKQLQELENAVIGISGLRCGLAVLDRSFSEEAWSAVEFACQLKEEFRDRHVVYFSGVDKDRKEAEKLLAVAADANCCNIVPVSGDLGGQGPRTGSGELFRMARERGLFTGCTVNPFQYTPWSLMAQYYKLAARLRCDAGFFVTQCGWDMLKMQSLAWFLLKRELFVPGFARLCLLTPERAEKIAGGGVPGVVIPPQLQKTLEKELSFSRNQFEAAQLRRLELQAAGCRLLGYNGIQLSGADNPRIAAVAAERIAVALKDFTDFDEFLNCYYAEMAESEVDGFSSGFQLFDQQLHRSYPFDAPPASRALPEVKLSLPEKMKELWERNFHSCQKCDVCTAPLRQGICTIGECAKHLLHGPCGGVRADGKCESGECECVYSKYCRAASAAGNPAEMEEELVRSLEG